MREKSAYEGYLDRTGMACLGWVKDVDAKARVIRVKTIGMPGTDDLDLYNVRVLHGMWHPDGDEEVTLPRLKTYGVILFIGTEAFWIGAIPLLMANGEKQRKNQVTLNAGDKVIKTVAGNRIIVRTGGTIEIQSTQLCRTFWIPSQNLINSVCQNFELETSGGHMKWRLDQKEETTNLQLKVWNGLAPDNAVIVDVGTIPDINNEDSKENIKPYTASDLVFDFRQGGLDDNHNLKPRSMRVSVKKDGSMYFDIGPEKFTLTVDAATGDVNFETKGTITGLIKKDLNTTIEGQVTALVKKDVTATIEGSVSATIKKDLTATVTGKATVTAKGGVDILTDGSATITSKGSATIKATGEAKMSSSAKATVMGDAGTDVGSGGSPTQVQGSMVALGGGGLSVARIGDMVISIGNLGMPAIGTIMSGSPKVTSG